MRKTFFSILVTVFVNGLLSAQADTSRTLEEVTVQAYLDKEPLLRVPASITLVDSAGINAYPGQSLLPALNTVAGLRMEERSPMSYRLSIRGSLLRSPFGIRNVKIYIDEFALSDAGGNAYLNLIDISVLSSIEALKGPNGSLFGANSGGVVRLDMMNAPPENFRLVANTGAGAFGSWNENVKLEKHIGKHTFSFSEAVQRTDGYRENSAAQRIYLQATESWRYNPASEVRALFFYSDLDYRTPGGLNLDQWNTNPRAARPATATLPGAAEQKAGVHNNTFFGGLLHETHFGKYFRHVIALSGSHTDFENPFITNYETRKENTTGLRTWIEAKNDQQKNFAWKYDLGFEAQQTFSEINNYENLSGTRGTLLDEAELHAIQDFVFTRFTTDLYHRVQVEASASVNQMRYTFSDTAASGSRKFSPELMPRFALSWLVTSYIAWRVSAAKGYSPPTLAEIRSSDNVVNTTLRPESGWNYETGFRFRDRKGRAQWDFCVFYYRLEDAIVRRLNDNGEEYFINAGGTKQLGAELQTATAFIQREHGFIRKLKLSNGSSLYNFTFDNYIVGTEDYSGNQLTGVPVYSIVSRLELLFPQNITLFIGHGYTAAIPLNDANSVFTQNYRIVDLKLSWQYSRIAHYVFGASFGINNLLNERYSLGHDLNAAGGRYYNASPTINYTGSIFVRFE